MRGSFLRILSSYLTIIAWLRQDIALAGAIFCRSQAQNEVWHLGVRNGGLLQILEAWIEVSTLHYTLYSLKPCYTAGYTGAMSALTLHSHYTTLHFLRHLPITPSFSFFTECSVV